jgi:hypothetical protein
LHEQHGELAQPDLELGLGLVFPEAEGDPAELRLPPVATTTPVPEPARTTVPISAQQLSSASGVPAGTASADFSAGTDSPVSTDSSHSSPAVASSRTSAGTTSPSCKSTTSPGTSSVTSADRGCR